MIDYDMADMPDYESQAHELRIQLARLQVRLTAADALAEKSRRLEEAIINCEADRYLDIIVEWREWQDALRQYGKGRPAEAGRRNDESHKNR